MCYHPNLAGLSKYKINGVRKLRFGLTFADHPMYELTKLPCGKCIACRLKYSREWALRCDGEARSFDRNCFITLTLNDAVIQHVHGPSLQKEFYPLFMKRLRKRFGDGIRYFMAGEYGEKFNRPHYHACIFNFEFDDLVLFKRERGIDLFRSMELEKLWSHPVHRFPYGYCTVGSVTFDSAAYVARYCTKKVGGKLALAHYRLVNSDDSVTVLKPEYATMSRRPGIGSDWFKEFGKEIYVTDSIIAKRGLEVKPPRYYDSLYEIECPEDYARVKKRRQESALKLSHDQTPDRLEVREKVHLRNASLLIRGYEKGDI